MLPELLEDERGRYMRLPMRHGQFVLIDEADWPLVRRFNWFVYKHKRSWYCARRRPAGEPGAKHIPLHRELMTVESAEFIDHRDGNGLNNRRYNLRPCTIEQNNQNSSHQLGIAGYRGVNRRNRRWAAKISVNGRNRHLGYFTTPEQAARAYDEAVRTLRGEFARVNFPEGQ